ncbi:hypothetical protein BDD12DRAFT_899504 [Trichophaea hybrida]|nr:hypothetical protein BDD12DRAFT_899504 [Trichophaea hybrida]
MWDADQFQVKRSRIPTDTFQKIISNIDQMLQAYGSPELHGTKDARSRFLAPLWHRIVAKFGMLIRNIPESMIHGRITTQGGIEYQFQSFGFNLPVYGILSDGSSWIFFRFNRAVEDGKVKLRVARGAFSTEDDRPYLEYSIPPFQSTKKVEYVRSLRPVCEYIYFILLTRFVNSIGAFYDQSTRRQSQRSSTPQWPNSRTVARNALEKALLAARLAEETQLTGYKDFSIPNSFATEVWAEVDDSVRLARAAQPHEYHCTIKCCSVADIDDG